MKLWWISSIQRTRKREREEIFVWYNLLEMKAILNKFRARDADTNTWLEHSPSQSQPTPCSMRNVHVFRAIKLKHVAEKCSERVSCSCLVLPSPIDRTFYFCSCHPVFRSLSLLKLLGTAQRSISSVFSFPFHNPKVVWEHPGIDIIDDYSIKLDKYLSALCTSIDT